MTNRDETDQPRDSGAFDDDLDGDASVETARRSVIPLRIGPYEVVRKLGDGGMAETFEAMRTRAGGFRKRVCIKRVLYPFLTDDTFREEFIQEARLLAELDHDGIVQAYDYDEDQGLGYLVMQLVDGVDFASILDHYANTERKLPPGVAAYVAAEVAEALSYLHSFVDADGTPRRIVHRDISPQNILISRRGEVKLADFGIAKFEGRPKLTKTSQTKGKLWYMSPEHIEPQRGLDARSDLFSLGVVLYQALSGIAPFHRETHLGTHHAILEGVFEPLIEWAPYLDPELAQLVEQLLAPDKEQRLQSARELALLLRTLAPHPDPKRALASAVSECLAEASDEKTTETAAQVSTTDWLEKLRSVPSRKPRTTRSQHKTSQPPSGAATTAPFGQRRARPHRWLLRSGLAFTLTAAAALILWRYSPTPTSISNASSAPASTTPTAEPTPKPAVEPMAEPEAAADADSGREVPKPTEPVAPASTVPAVSEPEPKEPNEPAAEPARTSDHSSRTARDRGTLKILVLNWGYVWVDGDFKGRSPVFVEGLAPGVHLVSASQVPDKPGKPEKVRVAPGKLQKHVIRLNDPLFGR